MSLRDLIYPNRNRGAANSANSANEALKGLPDKVPASAAFLLTSANAANAANAANTANACSEGRSKLATVSSHSQNKSEAGALASVGFAGKTSRISRISISKSPMSEIGGAPAPDVAPFWPWAPHLTASDIARLRTELAVLIAALANLEHWPDDLCAEVLDRAARDPLSCLLGNVAHFRDRLADAQADVQAREVAARRAWRFNSES